MKVQLNLSIDIDEAKQVQEMKKRGITPSRVFSKFIREFAKNDFKLPLTLEEDRPVI